MLSVGIAFSPVLDDAGALREAVAVCRAGRVGVELEMGVVHICARGTFDRFKVSLVPIPW